MSRESVRTVSLWLKGAGAAFVVTAGSFAACAADGGFGRSAETKKGVYALSAAIAGVGWILAATGLSWHPETQVLWRSLSVWALCGAIAATAATAFWYRADGQAVPAAVIALHAAAWALLAGAVSVVRRGGSVEVDARNLVLGAGAAAAVSAGTFLVRPWERAGCLAEGPAQLLVVAGWLMIAAAE